MPTLKIAELDSDDEKLANEYARLNLYGKIEFVEIKAELSDKPLVVARVRDIILKQCSKTLWKGVESYR